MIDARSIDLAAIRQRASDNVQLPPPQHPARHAILMQAIQDRAEVLAVIDAMTAAGAPVIAMCLHDRGLAFSCQDCYALTGNRDHKIVDASPR